MAAKVPIASTSPFITASMPENSAIRSERAEEGLDGMLGDAVHAPRLAA